MASEELGRCIEKVAPELTVEHGVEKYNRSLPRCTNAEIRAALLRAAERRER